MDFLSQIGIRNIEQRTLSLNRVLTNRLQETGRKVLKLSPMHARYILGMDKDESHALLTELGRHICDERFAYLHNWGKDDMIVWDNWRMLHGATGVPLHCKRVAQRTTIMGDYKVGRYLDPALDRDRIEVWEVPERPTEVRVEIAWRLRRTGAGRQTALTLELGS